MPKITPFLWFNNQAEEAMNFYIATFGDAKVHTVKRYPEGSPGPAGSVMTAQFELMGQTFIALNGGPHYSFTPAISFVVDCQNQAEVDHYWSALTDGGTEVQCGWLVDRFGLSWQVVPTVLPELLGGPDPAAAQRAMQAMMKMKKLDIAELQRAYAGSAAG